MQKRAAESDGAWVVIEAVGHPDQYPGPHCNGNSGDVIENCLLSDPFDMLVLDDRRIQLGWNWYRVLTGQEPGIETCSL